jgi:hypothetical protein
LQKREIDCLVVHQVTGIWVAAANTQPTAVASDAPVAAQAAEAAAPEKTGPDHAASDGSAAMTATDGSALDQATAPSAGAPAAASWRVQLAAYRSLAATKRGEGILKAKAGDVLPELQGLTRRNADGTTENGINFRLRTADLPDRAAATTLCGVLKERGIPCLVIHHRPNHWTTGG